MTKIGEGAYKGKSSKLILDDGIEEVQRKAFAGSKIQEVKWAASCTIIPSGCFERSKIRSITGIENVEYIDRAAFVDTPTSKYNFARWAQNN